MVARLTNFSALSQFRCACLPLTEAGQIGPKSNECKNSIPNTSNISQCEKKLVPSPLQNHKRIEALNTLVEDVEASSDCWEKADELSISVNDGQFSDISSVAEDDIDIISRKVEEYTVSTESRQVIEEMEVAVGSTSLSLWFWSGEGTSFFSHWDMLEVLGILFLHSFPHRLCPFDYLLHYRYLFCWVHSLSFCYLPLHITMPRACIV
jgi:hypothetical protein